MSKHVALGPKKETFAENRSKREKKLNFILTRSSLTLPLFFSLIQGNKWPLLFESGFLWFTTERYLIIWLSVSYGWLTVLRMLGASSRSNYFLGKSQLMFLKMPAYTHHE